jgi:hypothetical protein
MVAAPIEEKKVKAALRVWIGTAMLENTSIAYETANVLRRYSPFRQSLDELRDSLDTFLFKTLHSYLGSSMSVRLDDGRIHRIPVRDMEPMADDLMGVLFDSLSVYSVNFEQLNAYALTHESLAALRVLYEKYADMMSPAEREVLVSIVKDVYPPERYSAWLK